VAADKFEDRWGHFRDLVEHLFQEPGRSSVEADVVWYPATDAYETDSTFVIRLDVSGVRREDIQILMRGACVLVRGIRRDESLPGRKTFHKMEIAMGPFARSIQVPEAFGRSEASATYRDGVLEIRLRAQPQSGTQELQIEVE
jgi:HSP20 family protein